MSSPPSTERALPYHEPPTPTLLILSTFILLLNAAGHLFDTLIHCGLIGQILIGITWGAPGAQWLSITAQEVVVQLGYLGLVLLVFEGGLSTDLPALRANIGLSIGVAATDIALPIASSYLLMRLLDASALQAFAAGASLCSTSLGTTFSLLESTGLGKSRLGVVLTSAAMLDDVFGLVMVQVVSSLGATTSKPSTSVVAVAVVRPLFVAVAFAVLLPVIVRYIVLPLVRRAREPTYMRGGSLWSKMVTGKSSMIAFLCIWLLSLVAAGSYAGTSNLFVAYIAGASLVWLDEKTSPLRPPSTQHSHQPSQPCCVKVFATHIKPLLDGVLKPFFYASIGFAIPIAEIFRADIVWKGIVYTLLMTASKGACGIWLIRLRRPLPGAAHSILTQNLRHFPRHCTAILRRSPLPSSNKTPATTTTTTTATQNPTRSIHPPHSCINLSTTTPAPPPQTSRPSSCPPSHHHQPSHPSNPPNPRSLYPATLLATAMVSRGEIGFLISSLALTSRALSTDMFLVVTWAITMCTVIGPISMGLLVKRVRGLERMRRRREGGGSRGGDVLGVWGVGRG